MQSGLPLGIFDYVNIWPVYYRFLFENAYPDICLIRGTPNFLNQELKEGNLLVSCISSIQYPFLKSEIFLIPSLALASEGPVKSVFLIARSSLKNLSGGKVFATRASSTSAALLKILLNLLEVKAEIIPCENPLSFYAAASAEKTGCLIIGDEALRFGAASHSNTGDYLYDLGELWFQTTGKPFVWAVWGIRKNAPGGADLAKGLLDSRESGLKHLDVIANRAADRLNLSGDFLKRYFLNFSYTLGDREKEGLLFFYDYASKFGFSPASPDLEFSDLLATEKTICS